MTTDIILKAHGITKEFGGFVAVDNVNLDVRRGSVHALIGPNGAGKTTLFNLLTRFLPVTGGTIFFNGSDITRLHPADIARRGLVRSFQISAVYPHMTVLENVRVGLQSTVESSFAFWRSGARLKMLEDRAYELLDSVGLLAFARDLAADLPYGRKRALEIAATLALDPEMMLLDEPTAGMGHEDVDKIAELIKKAAVSRTVLVVEHNLNVVAHLSDRITVLQRGRILAEGDYATVSGNPAVREAYMGVGHA